jgi:hypothetical protein
MRILSGKRGMLFFKFRGVWVLECVGYENYVERWGALRGEGELGEGGLAVGAEGELGAAVVGEGEAAVDHAEAFAAEAGAEVGAGVSQGDLDVGFVGADVEAGEAVVAGGDAVLDRVLGEREEDHRRDEGGGGGGIAGELVAEAAGVADAVELEEVAAEIELAGERPGGLVHAGEDGAQHGGEAEHGGLGDGAVLAAPLGDRVEGVEEEVRVEVGAHGEELGALGFTREGVGAGALAREALLKVDVAAEAPAADPKEGEGDDEALAAGEEGGADAEQAGERPAEQADEDETTCPISQDLEEGAQRRAAGGEAAPEVGGEGGEGEAHEHAEGERERVA